MDQPLTNQQHKGSVPVGQGSIGAQERGIISGDNVQFGRLRRRTRLSQSESQSSGPEEEQVSSSVDARRSGRAHNPQQDQEPPPAPAKPSACTGLQNKKSRNRTSSETEGGKGGSRGPMQRKRGHSETENRPRPDKPDMSGLQCLASEKVWFDKHRYDEAERRLYEGANGPATQQQQVKTALQQAKGRQQKRPHRNSSSNAGDQELVSRMKSLELENQTLHKVVVEMKAALQRLESRVAVLEKSPAPAAVQCAKTAPVRQVKVENGGDEDDDDDIDLFGSDDDDEEAERLKQERLDAYAAKKAKKPALIAKSSILLDVKPWDDETDMAKLEECVRSVQMDGLLWGASKLLPVGYGIKKLQISCVVEDDKVGTDILEEEITKFEDFVQSVDVAAFNKI
ncbi:eukaryotic translation elongation factor 1 delta a (guanine nucleotide exchange protein) isoform X2 [Betta splendens]|uniref:Eukaryotic translation elongation factor 1 delta a (Guanine nucleotide exchange protein) isoform X2 n=2 Tax=Betta splendens TaxID=158456 RepID=A0A6P7KYC4_BETSP|nr:eukaryotic translation elongation factor 1 delta a (guanine nucleotide exchange protein) isoform X2 [Betta splendens]